MVQCHQNATMPIEPHIRLRHRPHNSNNRRETQTMGLFRTSFDLALQDAGRRRDAMVSICESVTTTTKCGLLLASECRVQCCIAWLFLPTSECLFFAMNLFFQQRIFYRRLTDQQSERESLIFQSWMFESWTFEPFP
jgi:hypothetical protein